MCVVGVASNPSFRGLYHIKGREMINYYETGDGNLAALDQHYKKEARNDAIWQEAERELEDIIDRIESIYADDDLKSWRNKYKDFDGVDEYLKDALWGLVC